MNNSSTTSDSPAQKDQPSGRRWLMFTALVLLSPILLVGIYWLAGGMRGSDSQHSSVEVLKTSAQSAGLLSQPNAEAPLAQATSVKQHPLEAALKEARAGLAKINSDIQDYTATILKRERIDGVLGEEQKMRAKVRHEKTKDGQVTTPFSVYLAFDSPKSIKGREVIWVEGHNNGNLIVHPGGLFDVARVPLPPDGFLAMQGQRYPIMDIGVRNLVAKMIERGEKDLQYDDIIVEYDDDLVVNGRPCRLIEIKHTEQKPEHDFYIARIYIDNELQIPTRYAAYKWPVEKDGELVLEEEYTYTDVKTNVGLTDADFDPDNKEYAFP
ncbi:DUF1571 domain-containing protein [Lignipirellula cremea]|uniref:DUF1571 domain-containing protein n=1 Tax=Lignipirellula cremea TaxID=2528010 RepID=A0A518DVG5_9BACT|nr:DUF1571 domain-containing protein [Lignipirellula cremea]QDU95828.1 hypothetical protein Pla8534_36460 [Lignipirellula cremea]